MGAPDFQMTLLLVRGLSWWKPRKCSRCLLFCLFIIPEFFFYWIMIPELYLRDKLIMGLNSSWTFSLALSFSSQKRKREKEREGKHHGHVFNLAPQWLSALKVGQVLSSF